MRWLLVLSIVCFVPEWLGAGEKAAKPVLVLDAGGHTDSVPAVGFTPDGKLLISASKDKTVRIWDVATGEMLRVLRPSIDQARGGTLYAVAISADGKLLATAGIGPTGGENPIYIITLATGHIKRVLREPNSRIHSLAFSADGVNLASAGDHDTARIWKVETGEVTHVLRGHNNFIEQVSFSPDSRLLVTSGADSTSRIWQVETGKTAHILRDKVAPTIRGARSVAWSADGQYLAIGGRDSYIRLWGADGVLRKRYGPFGDAITSVSFMPGGGQLLFTRGLDLRSDCSILDLDTGKENVSFTAHSSGVWGGALSPNGHLAATGGFLGEELFLWKTADGSMVHRLGARSRAVWSAGWSPDNKTIAWGATGKRGFNNDLHPLERAFAVPDLEIVGTGGVVYQRARSARGTLSLAQRPGLLDVTEGTKVVTTLRFPKESPTCFTLLAGEQVAVGSRLGLYLFAGRTGERLRTFQGHTGTLLAVSSSPDGRFLLSASADHTLRIWTLDRDQPLLSFFFAGEDWVAWTPEGYYAASPGGENLMGWHVNNGPDQMASYYPAAQFRKSLYRPDVIKLLLKTGSVERALEFADQASGKKSEITGVAEVLPPFVLITAPDKLKVDVTESTVEVRFIAKPVGKHPITAVRLMVNGRPYPGADGLKKFETPRTNQVRDAWTVRLSPGVNTIAVQAESAVSKALSEPVEVTLNKARGAELEPDEKEKKLELPNLYVLAIGVSEYPQEALKLKYAAKDATVLAKTLQATSHSLYRNVEVKVLTDKDATRRNILQGLTWLRKQMTQRDVAIVSFAGHGSQDADGKLYLLPVDVDKEDLLSTAVPGEQIKSVLGGIPGRVIVLLDACHSGAVDGDKRRAAGSLTDDLVRDLVTDDYGVIVMCSSMGREFSLESATVEHGFFTLALVEGLSGKADYNKSGVVYLNGLDLYVTTRVKELSKGKQHPVTTRPTSIRSFPLSRPEKQSSSRVPGVKVPRVLVSRQDEPWLSQHRTARDDAGLLRQFVPVQKQWHWPQKWYASILAQHYLAHRRPVLANLGRAIGLPRE